MTEDPANNLDHHLERLMETAYEGLASGDGEHRRRSGADVVEPEPPERIGPYPVSGLLGRGGTSFVWKGHDPELGRDLAIKVIDQRHQPGSVLAQRFLDEARLCSQLSHPGIVPIYDVGHLEDGRPYFTMRLVEGDTLTALLDGRVDPDDRLQQFLEIFARVCETVAFAHARGIVHGDLKPGNVMVGAYGQVQVMDWGFSRPVEGPAANAAGSGRLMGTPAFMAPEQARHGNPIDARTDVFGLGAILCVILTGAPPYLGGGRTEIALRAARGCVGDALARLQGGAADPELAQLAADCLAASPEARPADANQVATRVSAWFASIKERAHRLELAAAQARVKAVEQRRTRRRTVVLALLAAAFAAMYAWLQFERQARDYETRMAVTQAIERARSLRIAADINGPERIRWLGEAALAAQHGKALASTLDHGPLRDEAEQLARRLDGDRDAAVRDEKMVLWLDDYPSHLDDFPSHLDGFPSHFDLTRDQLDLSLADGFRSYGVDVEALPADESVARLRESSIAPALARALDDWGHVRHGKPRVKPAAWQQFHELALRIDADPLRSAVRRAVIAGDRDALRHLVDAPEFRDAPADTLDLLANCLSQSNQRPAAIQVWQRANARHPDSVRVIHSLAAHLLGDATCPPWDEIVRLISAGVALRPGSAHLWTDLSSALLGRGDVVGAEAALHRALELAPQDRRAVVSLVGLLRCQGRPADALAQSRAAADRAPDAPVLWRLHGHALLIEGFVSEAADAFRRAVALGGAAIDREVLCGCVLDLGGFDEVVEACRGAPSAGASSAWAQAKLGLALRQQGKFVDAVAALRESLDAGGAFWLPPGDALLEETERAAARARTLADLGDDAPPFADAQANVELALVAHLAGRSVLAARFYRAAFELDPAVMEGAFIASNRDQAVGAAAQVSSGASRDAARLDAEERARWHAQAIAWWRDGMAAVARAFDAGELAPSGVRRRIAFWRHASALAGLRPELHAELAALEAHVAVGEPQATVLPPFDRTYAFRTLGRVPGVLAPYGGLLFDRADPDALVVTGHAGWPTATLSAVSLTRDERGHVNGFRGSARHLAAVPFADAGLARGPKDVVFYTTHGPTAQLGQLRPGSRTPDRVDQLPGPPSGGFAFVPSGLPGAGRTKRLAWPSGEWFDAGIAAESDGFVLEDPRQVTTLDGGPQGFAYLATGAPPFARPTVMVAEWSRSAIAAYDVDANGDPVLATRRLVLSGCRGAMGLAIDPATGDVLVSTSRGDGTEQIGLLYRTGD